MIGMIAFDQFEKHATHYYDFHRLNLSTIPLCALPNEIEWLVTMEPIIGGGVNYPFVNVIVRDWGCRSFFIKNNKRRIAFEG